MLRKLLFYFYFGVDLFSSPFNRALYASAELYRAPGSPRQDFVIWDVGGEHVPAGSIAGVCWAGGRAAAPIWDGGTTAAAGPRAGCLLMPRGGFPCCCF